MMVSKPRLSRVGVLMSLVTICLLGATASATNLVTNGSFEDPGYADGVWSSSPPTGWTIPGGWGVGYENGNPTVAEFPPQDGDHANRTDGSDYNKVWQEVTIPGGVQANQVYELTAYIRSLADPNAGYKVAWAQMYLYDKDGPSSSNWVYNGWETVDEGAGWHKMTTTLDTSLEPAFVGSGTMTIELYNSNDNPIAWDNVSLILVPEPASLTLVVMGMACVASIGWRRRK